MARAPLIFIDDENGMYSRTRFRRLSKAAKLELMEAWFRERYEDPVNETPRDSGEYIYVWGGPFDPFDELNNEFGEFVSTELIEALANRLYQEAFEWAPTSKYHDRDEEEDRAPPANQSKFLVGTPEELAFREEISRRLDRVEKVLAQRPESHGMMGHNRPPQGIDDDATIFEDLSRAVAQIKTELEKADPGKQPVAEARDTISRIRGAIVRKFDFATDQFAKRTGDIGAITFWTTLGAALGHLLAPLTHWLEHVVTLMF